MRRGPAAALRVLLSLAVVGGGACARDGSGDGETEALDRRLGETPSTLDPSSVETIPPVALGEGDGGGAGTPTGPGGATPTTRGGSAGAGGSTASRCGGFKPAGGGTDATGDAGVGAPSYADLIGIGLEDDGDRLKVVVQVNGPLPPALGERETVGVGVDLYAAGERESRYQLFVQGDTDGWLAYLYTPKGLVDYPGTFALGGNQMVLTVPWSALSPSLQAAGVFLDWSKPALALNTGGSDRLPASGTTVLRRC